MIRSTTAFLLLAFQLLSPVSAGTPEKKNVSESKTILCTEMTPSSKGIWEWDYLTGDWGGERTRLAEHGFELTVDYTGETMGVVTGGVQRGFTYEHRLEVGMDFDFEKMTGWKGGAFHVSSFWIEGTTPNNLRGAQDIAAYTGSLSDPSNIDAYDTFRLFELYLEQRFFEDKLTVRVGQLAADAEFFTSDYGSPLFVNGTFGWPNFMAANQPNGGAGYPSATTGIFLKVQATPELYFMSIVQDGNPGAQNGNNRHGTNFRIAEDEGLFTMHEVTYDLNKQENDKGLPGAYSLGFWYHTDRFADQRFDSNGIPLSDDATLTGTASNGTALNHEGNYGFYGIIDQMLWREKNEGHEGLSFFTRLAGSPEADRTIIDFYAEGGVIYTGPIPTRDQDVLAVGVCYNEYSSRVTDFDRDASKVAMNGGNLPRPVRTSETILETTYRVQIAPWWYVQPDFQYFINTGGGIASPITGNRVQDAVVLGVRTGITF
ncbi:MAG: carbohydrate porin [Verrucomicrobiae bacterium]|nr:carbohydrate porin [Verrucomicrobiae bacterium]